jgi:hypothetical protein
MTSICNPDGTPYQLGGSLQQFDPDNPDLDLFNLWDEEAIKIGGSPIFYYEVFIQVQNTFDPFYVEDRGKIYSNNPRQLYCSYEPVTPPTYMTQFGPDGYTPDMKFEFNYKAVLKAIGHPPKIGARLFTPHKRENWKIVERQTGEYKMWGELRLTLICERFIESRTTGEGRVTQKQPNTPKLNETNLFRPTQFEGPAAADEQMQNNDKGC